jgi:acyl carrier protein
MSIQQTVEKFITEELLLGNRTQTIDLDQDLIGTGFLDSLAVMQLILFIEERFKVKVADGEVLPDNFRTIERIIEFVESKQSAPQTA